jgi:hypothetical protein
MDQPETSGQPTQNSGPLAGLSFRGPASPDSNDSGEQHTPENGTLHEITQEHPEMEKDGGKRERKGRRKINIEFIDDKSRRHITFSKRKSGIMKKAYELATLTGTQVLLLVASETGHVYTFATNKLQPLITKAEGKNLIQACLNAPDMSAGGAPPISMSTSRVSANHNFSASGPLENSGSFMPSGSQEPVAPDQPANFNAEPEEKKKVTRGQNKQELRGLVAAATNDMPPSNPQPPQQQMQVALGNVPYGMGGPLGMHPIAALANHQMLNANMMQQSQAPGGQQNPNQSSMNQGQNQMNAQLAQMAQQGQGMPNQGQGMPGLMGSSLGGINLPPYLRNPMFGYGPPPHGQFNLGPSFGPGPNGAPPNWSFKGPGGQPHPILQSLHAQQMLNEGSHPEGNHGGNSHPQHGMPGGHHPQSQHDDDHYNQ